MFPCIVDTHHDEETSVNEKGYMARFFLFCDGCDQGVGQKAYMFLFWCIPPWSQITHAK